MGLAYLITLAIKINHSWIGKYVNIPVRIYNCSISTLETPPPKNEHSTKECWWNCAIILTHHLSLIGLCLFSTRSWCKDCPSNKSINLPELSLGLWPCLRQLASFKKIYICQLSLFLLQMRLSPQKKHETTHTAKIPPHISRFLRKISPARVATHRW